MNPHSTWTKALSDDDERFVAEWLDAQGLKAVKKDAIVIDLDAAYGCWAEKRDPALIVAKLRETNLVTCAAIADQIEAQTRPPRPPEPQGLGAVVEDAQGGLWVRSHTQYPTSPWTRPESGGVYAWDRIDSPKVLSEGWSA